MNILGYHIEINDGDFEVEDLLQLAKQIREAASFAAPLILQISFENLFPNEANLVPRALDNGYEIHYRPDNCFVDKTLVRVTWAV